MNSLSQAALTIVLAEDDHDHRAVVCELLSEEGYRVNAVKSGAEALTQLQTTMPPLLLITDLHMPDMDGRQLIAAMRQDEKLAAVPVIVMTGSRARDVAPIEHVQGMLEKPFRLNLLLELVSRHCR